MIVITTFCSDAPIPGNGLQVTKAFISRSLLQKGPHYHLLLYSKDAMHHGGQKLTPIGSLIEKGNRWKRSSGRRPEFKLGIISILSDNSIDACWGVLNGRKAHRLKTEWNFALHVCPHGPRVRLLWRHNRPRPNAHPHVL